MQKAAKKYGLWAVQVVLVAGSGWLLYSKLLHKDFVQEITTAWAALHWWHFAVVLLLSAINWLFDTRTWQLILRPFARIAFVQALKINVVAQSAGAITPLAVGDYGLRSYLLRDVLESRQNALLSMSYRLIKMVVRIILGLLCIVYASVLKDLFLLGALLALVLMFASGTAIRGAITMMSKTKQADKVLKERKRIDFSTLNLKRVLVPTVLLFVAYSIETALLIFWMAPDAGFIAIWIWVIITYSVTSFLPATGIFDPMIKSAFGALFAVQLAAPSAIILVAFTITWCVNLGVPGFISSLLFRKVIAKSRA